MLPPLGLLSSFLHPSVQSCGLLSTASLPTALILGSANEKHVDFKRWEEKTDSASSQPRLGCLTLICLHPSPCVASSPSQHPPPPRTNRPGGYEPPEVDTVTSGPLQEKPALSIAELFL